MEAMGKLIEFFSGKGLVIPLGDIIIIATLITLCILLDKYKSGLMLAYGFILYWGFIANSTYFMTLFDQSTMGLFIYAISGFTMIISILFGLLHKS